jgi:hypothetical protein
MSAGVSTPVGLGGSATAPSPSVAFIGGDDVGHDAMPHDISRIEMDEAEAIDSIENTLQPVQAASPVGNIDLCRVTGDDHF